MLHLLVRKQLKLKMYAFTRWST